MTGLPCDGRKGGAVRHMRRASRVNPWGPAILFRSNCCSARSIAASRISGDDDGASGMRTKRSWSAPISILLHGLYPPPRLVNAAGHGGLRHAERERRLRVGHTLSDDEHDRFPEQRFKLRKLARQPGPPVEIASLGRMQIRRASRGE